MLVLASASPRRREILSRFVREFRVIPSTASEECSLREPGKYALELARRKARDVHRKVGGTVIGADTVVSIDGRILGKPSGRSDAVRMLRLLSGRTHKVTTAYCIIHGEKEISGAVTTEVRFRELNDELINAYVRSGEPMDKAGAYGIQGLGGLLVEGISGDYYNVVGFPMEIVWRLRELGFEVMPL